MRHGETRILTTHTGSLPRPPSLVELYVREARGEAVDEELTAAAHASMEDTVRRQHDAGTDIGNHGENIDSLLSVISSSHFDGRHLFSRHGPVCPGHLYQHSAATGGQDTPGHDEFWRAGR